MQVKPSGEAGAKPAKRTKQAANGDTAVNQLSTTVPAFQQALDATAQATSAAVPSGTNPGAAVAAAPQLALPVVEDKAPASMLAGGVVALPSRVCLPLCWNVLPCLHIGQRLQQNAQHALLSGSLLPVYWAACGRAMAWLICR